MPSTVRKVVIPAAGLGTRLLPATKVVPKELLPVSGRPAIQFAVEEAVTSGFELVILVIGPHSLTPLHFRADHALEDLLARSGRVEEAESLRRLADMVELRTVVQPVPLGLADAIRQARPLIGSEPFAVTLPDAIIDSEIPVLRQLADCYEKCRGSCVATRRVSPEDVERFGIVDVFPQDRDSDPRIFRVMSLTERPRRGLATSDYGIFGRYILEPAIFACMDTLAPGLAGELQLTDALQLYSRTMPIYAYKFEGTHYDVGNKLGLLLANIAFSLKDSQIASSLAEHLASLDLLRPEPAR